MMDEKKALHEITVDVSARIVNIDELAEKMNQLKTLLLEVKELAASLDVDFKLTDQDA